MSLVIQATGRMTRTHTDLRIRALRIMSDRRFPSGCGLNRAAAVVITAIAAGIAAVGEEGIANFVMLQMFGTKANMGSVRTEPRESQGRLEALLLDGLKGEETEFTEESWRRIREEALLKAKSRKNGSHVLGVRACCGTAGFDRTIHLLAEFARVNVADRFLANAENRFMKLAANLLPYVAKCISCKRTHQFHLRDSESL